MNVYRVGVDARFLALVLFIVCIGLQGGRADAMTELCPAAFDGFHTFSVGNANEPATLVSYQLTGASARTVSGTVVFDTDAGWYSVPFDPVQLSARTEHWKAPNIELQGTRYDSLLLYVRFPRRLSVIDGYVSSAAADAQTAWGGKGIVTCKTPADLTQPKWDAIGHSEPAPELETPPAANTTIATAISIPPPGNLDCPQPFANVKITLAMQPDYPQDAMREIHDKRQYTAIAQVAVNEKGMADAWLWASSGNHSLDSATLHAAQLSHYAPGVSFCAPSPGMYLFRADYRRDL